MQPELEIITKEIPAKGKAYIIVRRWAWTPRCDGEPLRR